jgi:hypothetical protein
MAVENSLRLDPVNVIIYVYKNNIEYVNNVLKRKPYSKKLKYYMSDMKFEDYFSTDLLVIPGNYPFLSVKTLQRMIRGKNVKINDSLFFLKADSLHLFDTIDKMHITKDFIVSSSELKKIEKEKDLYMLKQN